MSKLINCKTCGAQISDQAKVCPHCGEKNTSTGIVGGIKLVGKILLGVFIFIIILTIITPSGNLTSSSNTSRSDNENETEIINSKFEIISGPEMSYDSLGVVSIKGAVKNISGRDLSYAQITFGLYDNEGAQIGTAVANINNLEKDGTWKYTATPLTMDSWVRYKLINIDCW